MIAPKEGGKRYRLDWDAMERDFRTGAFTQRELAAKYKTSFVVVCRRIAKDRAKDPDRWNSDLSSAVRQATNAMLVSEMVTKTITDGQLSVNETVLAAAEIGKQVILEHRSRIKRAITVALNMLDELESATINREQLLDLFERTAFDADQDELKAARGVMNEFFRLHNRVGSIHKLLDALSKAQAMERQAYNISDGESTDDRARRTLPIVFVDSDPQQNDG